ncbi:MAG: tail fiber domain-containing protein [Pseudomonadota bacterium]
MKIFLLLLIFFSSTVQAQSVNFGRDSIITGTDAAAFGFGTQANGDVSAAFGDTTEANGYSAMAFGLFSIANGETSAAFGYQTQAEGIDSVSFGTSSIANGDASVVFGQNTQANGASAAAFGFATIAEGIDAVAFGTETFANGESSSSFGFLTQAIGLSSSAFGEGTQAQAKSAFVIGEYNSTFPDIDPILSAPNDPIFVVGNGTVEQSRNAMTIFRNGSILLNGPLTVTGKVTTISDEKYKTAIQDFDEGLQRVRNMQPVYYKMRNDDSQQRQIGFIAQELESIVPEVIHRNTDKTLSVAYGQLNAVLVGAIKTLDAENQQLKAALCELKDSFAFCE